MTKTNEKRRRMFVVVTRIRGNKSVFLASSDSWSKEGPARRLAKIWQKEEPTSEFGVAEVDLSMVWIPERK